MAFGCQLAGSLIAEHTLPGSSLIRTDQLAKGSNLFRAGDEFLEGFIEDGDADAGHIVKVFQQRFQFDEVKGRNHSFSPLERDGSVKKYG